MSTDTTAASDGPLLVSIDDGVALLHLDDGKANAFSHTLLEQLHAGLDHALAQASSVVVAGRPGRFSAGFDLAVMNSGDKPMQDLVLAGAEWFLRLYSHPQPTVAACTGHALAAGAITLMACDTRIGASGSFKIGLNEVSIGLRLPAFAVEMARDRLASSHLVAATVQAQVYDPQEAVAAGYLDSVCAPDDVLGNATAVARQLGEMHHSAIGGTKNRLRSASIDRIRSNLRDDIGELTFG